MELRARFAGADVLADEVSFGDRDIELGRGLIEIRSGILNDEALRARLLLREIEPGSRRRAGAATARKNLQSEIAANPVLQMDHVVAGFEIAEIDVQGGTCGCGVG